MIRRHTFPFLLFLLTATVMPLQAQDYLGGNLRLKEKLDDPIGYCFDLFGFGTGVMTNEPISVHTCKNEGWRDATFTVDYPAQGQLYAPAYDMCAEVTRAERGAHLILQECSDSELQRFIYRENQTIELVPGEGRNRYCVVVHPADGIPTGGPGHIRREVYVYGCDAVALEHAQWILPEDGTGLAAPDPDPANAPPPENPQLTAAAGFYAGACARCHGYQAEGNTDLQSPKLTGLTSEYLTRQFYYFVNSVRGGSENERWASQMVNHVAAMGEDRRRLIENASNLIANMPEVEIEKTVEGDIENGEQIYQSSCAQCHAVDGSGIETLHSPRLAGMTDWYMLKQMQKFRDGRRGAHPDDEFGPLMVPSAQVLEDDEAMKDVIAYINTL